MFVKYSELDKIFKNEILITLFSYITNLFSNLHYDATTGNTFKQLECFGRGE